MSRKIYLDYAAATPMRPEVLRSMLRYFSEEFYNPSANYLSARAAKKDLASARATIAGLLGAKPAEIIFTAGATEANNLAIQGIVRQYEDGEVLVSAIEHESVLAPAQLFKHQEIPIDANGLIILNKLSNLITDKTVLLSVMLVNNELGTIQPLVEISKIVNKVRAERQAKDNSRPLYLHTDAAQAGNYLDLHASRLGVDLMSINGGKVYGPKQSGVLYIKAGLKIVPQIVGGGQEFGLRSGTENVPSAVGLAKALELAQQLRATQQKSITELRAKFEAGVAQTLPEVIINGHPKHRAPHISSLTFNGIDNERLMMELDERGVECAVGSACSASNEEPSHALLALGLTPQQVRSTLRFSFGANTSQKDVARAVQAIAHLAAHNR